MDGLIAARPEPLAIVRDGIRYGCAAGGKVAWLPADLWAPAAELLMRMEAMNANAERLQRLIDAAQEEADAAGGVQIAWVPPDA